MSRMCTVVGAGFSDVGVVGTGRTVERPVAGRDARVVDDGDGAVEDMEGEPVQPPVPVTLVELVAGVWVTEEACTLTHLQGSVGMRLTWLQAVQSISFSDILNYFISTY